MPTPQSPSYADLTLAPDLTRTDGIGAAYRIAYRQDRKVCLADLSRGRPKRLFDERNRSLNCPLAWSADGETVYLSHRQIYAVNADTARKQAITDFHGNDEFSANWLLQRTPDGTSLVFISMPKPPGIKAMLQQTRLEPHRLCAVGIADKSVRILFAPEQDKFLWRAAAQPSSNRAIALVNSKGRAEIWAVNLDGTGSTLVTALDERIIDVALAPNGESVVCDTVSGLDMITIANGARRQITRFGHGPAWSPNGKLLAFVDGDHSLWMVDADGGEPQRRVWVDDLSPSSEERRGGYGTAPVWSPDGRLLWFRLTRSWYQEELDEPSRDFLAKLDQDFAGNCLSGISEAEREQMRRHSA